MTLPRQWVILSLVRCGWQSPCDLFLLVDPTWIWELYSGFCHLSFTKWLKNVLVGSWKLSILSSARSPSRIPMPAMNHFHCSNFEKTASHQNLLSLCSSDPDIFVILGLYIIVPGIRQPLGTLLALGYYLCIGLQASQLARSVSGSHQSCCRVLQV
jgi:hypothetical protein